MSFALSQKPLAAALANGAAAPVTVSARYRGRRARPGGTARQRGTFLRGRRRARFVAGRGWQVAFAGGLADRRP